jgi:hypothetical protein
VDVLGFQIKLWCKYFGIFGHFLQKLGEILFYFLVTLVGDDVKKFFNIDSMSAKTQGVVDHSLTEAAMEAADTFDVKEMEGKIGERN